MCKRHAQHSNGLHAISIVICYTFETFSRKFGFSSMAFNLFAIASDNVVDTRLSVPLVDEEYETSLISVCI